MVNVFLLRHSVVTMADRLYFSRTNNSLITLVEWICISGTRNTGVNTARIGERATYHLASEASGQLYPDTSQKVQHTDVPARKTRTRYRTQDRDVTPLRK
jgi:hypothetical protein